MEAREGSNKEIQKSRMRSYFIEATMALISEEGISGITAKRIGDRAGYSYATIYNYFENLNALFCEALEALTVKTIKQIEETWGEDVSQASLSRLTRRIKSLASIMLDELGNNTKLYYPFISTEIDFAWFKQRDGHAFVHPAWELLRQEVACNAQAVHLDSSGIRVLTDILSYIFHAKLHFYIRYQVPESLDLLRDQLNEEIDHLLQL